MTRLKARFDPNLSAWRIYCTYVDLSQHGFVRSFVRLFARSVSLGGSWMLRFLASERVEEHSDGWFPWLLASRARSANIVTGCYYSLFKQERRDG